MRYVFIMVVAILWFPTCLERSVSNDFPIYYDVARGIDNPAYVYPAWTAIFFAPLAWVSYRMGFAIVYALGVLAWARFYRVGWLVGTLAAYPILLGLQAGNIAPILGVLCLTPAGAVLAMCFKFYLGLFVLLHAGCYAYRVHAKPLGIDGQDLPENQHRVSCYSVGNLE